MVQGHVLLVRMSRAMREIAADSIVVGIVICGSAEKNRLSGCCFYLEIFNLKKNVTVTKKWIRAMSSMAPMSLHTCWVSIQGPYRSGNLQCTSCSTVYLRRSWCLLPIWIPLACDNIKIDRTMSFASWGAVTAYKWYLPLHLAYVILADPLPLFIGWPSFLMLGVCSRLSS